MSLEGRAAALEALARGRGAVVWQRFIADVETPVSAALKLIEPGRGDWVLESVESGETRGRYSLIGLDPDLMFEVTGDAARINRDWRRDRDAFQPLETGALQALRDLVAECRFDVPEGLPKALATLVGFFAYETIGLVERIPRAPGAGLGLPDMIFVRPAVILVFDRLADELFLLAPIWPDAKGAIDRMIDAAQDRRADRVADLAHALAHPVAHLAQLAARPAYADQIGRRSPGCYASHQRCDPSAMNIPQNVLTIGLPEERDHRNDEKERLQSFAKENGEGTQEA